MAEEELEYNVGIIAKKFAEYSFAILMEGNSEAGSHLLSTTFPDSPERDLSTLRVAAPHLRRFVMHVIDVKGCLFSWLNKYRFTPRRAAIRFSEARLATSFKRLLTSGSLPTRTMNY
jgi:hypothetical protein